MTSCLSLIVRYLPFLLTLFLALSSSTSSILKAQGSPTVGKKFWVAWLQNSKLNYNDVTERISLVISTLRATNIQISTPNKGFNFSQTIEAASAKEIIIPSSVIFSSKDNKINPYGLFIESSDTISVYALNIIENTTEGALVLPIQLLGDEYLVMSYYENEDFSKEAQLLILATEDDTEINIVPSSDTNTGLLKGQKATIKLQKGEIYHCIGSEDLTGTHIKSLNCNKPIAVFSGNICGTVGNCPFCNHLYEQNFPIKNLGKRYAVIPFKSRNADKVRIMSAEPNTKIQFGTEVIHLSNAGEYITRPLQRPTPILSDQPIMVGQFCTGAMCETNPNADPFFVLVSPLEDLSNYEAVITSTGIQSIDSTFLSLVAPTHSTEAIRLNDQKLVGFQTIPYLSEWSYLIIPLAKNQSYRLSNPKGAVFTTIYGFGKADSYGFCGIVNLINYQLKIDTLARSICDQTRYEFFVRNNANITNYEWNFEEQIYTIPNPILEFKESGKYLVKLKVNQSHSCPDSTIQYFQIQSLPKSNFKFRSVIVQPKTISGANILVQAQKGSLPYEYKLDTSSFQSSNVFKGITRGIHEIIVKDQKDCILKRTIKIP